MISSKEAEKENYSNKTDELHKVLRAFEDWQMNRDLSPDDSFKLLSSVKNICKTSKTDTETLRKMIKSTSALGMCEGAPDELKLSSRILEIMSPWLEEVPFEELSIYAIQAWNQSLGINGSFEAKICQRAKPIVIPFRKRKYEIWS